METPSEKSGKRVETPSERSGNDPLVMAFSRFGWTPLRHLTRFLGYPETMDVAEVSCSTIAAIGLIDMIHIVFLSRNEPVKIRFGLPRLSMPGPMSLDSWPPLRHRPARAQLGRVTCRRTIPERSGENTGTNTSPCFSNCTRTGMPMWTSPGGQPTTLVVNRRPSCSTSSTIEML